MTAMPHLRTEVARQLADDDMPPVTWRRARRSQGNGECVEVAAAPGGGVWLRDSKRPAGPTLDLSPADWAALIATVRAGEAGAA